MGRIVENGLREETYLQTLRHLERDLVLHQVVHKLQTALQRRDQTFEEKLLDFVMILLSHGIFRSGTVSLPSPVPAIHDGELFDFVRIVLTLVNTQAPREDICYAKPRSSVSGQIVDWASLGRNIVDSPIAASPLRIEIPLHRTADQTVLACTVKKKPFNDLGSAHRQDQRGVWLPLFCEGKHSGAFATGCNARYLGLTYHKLEVLAPAFEMLGRVLAENQEPYFEQVPFDPNHLLTGKI